MKNFGKKKSGAVRKSPSGVRTGRFFTLLLALCVLGAAVLTYALVSLCAALMVGAAGSVAEASAPGAVISDSVSDGYVAAMASIGRTPRIGEAVLVSGSPDDADETASGNASDNEDGTASGDASGNAANGGRRSDDKNASGDNDRSGETAEPDGKAASDGKKASGKSIGAERSGGYVPVSRAETAEYFPAVSVGAHSAALMCAESGELLYELSPDELRPMASTTKIMTALVAIENASLDTVATVSPDAVGIIGSSVYLREGEQITLESLLYALLLESANDAATQIAITVGGDEAGFVAMMNEKAEQLGLSHTHFSNPHGLDSDGHYTTARELAAIAAAALENETFAEIAGTYKKVISTEDGSISRLLVNHNRMLRSYDGAIGVKTGYTSAAGRCLVSAARRDGVTLIAVTLDDHSDWADHTALLDAGFAAYSERRLCGAGELTYTLPLEGADEGSLTVSNGDAAAVVLPRGAELRQVVELPRFVFAPVRSGQTLGAVHYYVGEREVASVPLCAQQSAEEKQSGGISGFFASLGARISALLGRDE